MKNSTERLKAKTYADHVIETGEADYDKYAEKRDKQHKTIEEQKLEKKFMFQFVNHEDGTRSEPFVGSWDTVTEILNARKTDERPNNEDYILLVAVLDGKDTKIPATPLITIKTFEEISKKES